MKKIFFALLLLIAWFIGWFIGEACVNNIKERRDMDSLKKEKLRLEIELLKKNK